MQRCSSSLSAFGRILFCLGVLLRCEVSAADTLCRAKVSYSWKRGSDGAELSSYGLTVVARGATPELAKQALDNKLPAALDKAARLCAAEHEEEAKCLKTKFAHSAGLLSSMGFSARRKLEDSISEECKGRAGVCTGSKSEEAICVEDAVATPAPAAQEGGKTDAKTKK